MTVYNCSDSMHIVLHWCQNPGDKSMATSMGGGIVLPEHLQDDNARSWFKHFKACRAANGWNAAKRLASLLTLLKGRATDYGNSQSCPMGSQGLHRPVNRAWTKFSRTVRTVLIITLMTVLCFQMTCNLMGKTSNGY